MALSLGTLTAWADETSQATNFYTEALMANDAVPFLRTYGEVLNGVKANTIKLPTLTQTATFVDGDNCTFSDGNTTTITQSTLTLKNVKTEGLICVRDLEDYFTAVTLPAGQNYEGLGQMENAVLAEIIRVTQKNLAKEIWSGQLGSGSADGAVIDGLIEVLNDSSATATSTQTLTNGGSAGTDAAGAFNVAQGLVDVAFADEDLAGEAISGNLVLIMSPKARNLYFQNFRQRFGDTMFASLTAEAMQNNGMFMHPGSGIEVHTQNGLQQNADFMILTRKRNLVLGFDLESDTTGLMVGLDQYKEYMWWKIRFKLGVAIRDTSSASLLFNGTVS